MRQHNIPTAIYPENAKLSRQFKYADRLGVQFVVVIGPEEVKLDVVQVKDLVRGEQNSMGLHQAADWLRAHLADEKRA